MQYPKVHDEFKTVEQLKTGKSIARLGDGEFGILKGNGYVRNQADKNLTDEMRHVMRDTSNPCLIGIPTMNPRGAKYKNWIRHIHNYAPWIPGGREYYSAFITRPDSAQWIETQEFADSLIELWKGKNVVMVCPEVHKNKFLSVVKMTANTEAIECPTHEAYQYIDDFERECLKAIGDIVILSCGVTATCLAGRLAPHKQTLDLGSVGGFLQKAIGGEYD